MERLSYEGELLVTGDKSWLYKRDIFPDTHINIYTFHEDIEGGDELTMSAECNMIEIEPTLVYVMAEKFGFNLDALLAWMFKKYGESAPGFEDDDTRDDANAGKGYVDPIFNHLRKLANPERPLYIYTWGKRNHKLKPQQSQCNFNACIIGGKRHGLNLKQLTGLHADVQKGVISGTGYSTFMEQMVTKIERDDLRIISINCTAGRHRCVTCAEQLKKLFYPCATIEHIDLKHITR